MRIAVTGMPTERPMVVALAPATGRAAVVVGGGVGGRWNSKELKKIKVLRRMYYFCNVVFWTRPVTRNAFIRVWVRRIPANLCRAQAAFIEFRINSNLNQLFLQSSSSLSSKDRILWAWIRTPGQPHLTKHWLTDRRIQHTIFVRKKRHVANYGTHNTFWRSRRISNQKRNHIRYASIHSSFVKSLNSNSL